MTRLQLVPLLICLVPGAGSASAQDKGRVGVAASVPGYSIAAIWHVTEAIAIRPEVGLSRSYQEYPYHTTLDSPPITATTTSLTTSVGVSGILFVATHESLRTYVSPQVAYTRSSRTQAGSPLPDTTSSGYSAGGAVGAQYAIGHRFAAYGELGIEYEHTPNSGGIPNHNENSISTRSAVGVIMYF
jgi:hypothetical protein